MAVGVRPAPAAVGTNPMQLTFGSFICVALACGVLARARWGPLLETYLSGLHLPSPIREAVPIYVAVNIGHAYVLWLLNRLLVDVYNFRGADRPILVLIGVLCIDCIALLSLFVSPTAGFHVYPIPLGLYGLVLSYPHFAYLGLGVAEIAFGYSLLRSPAGPAASVSSMARSPLRGASGQDWSLETSKLDGNWLRPYALVQIATGAALAAPPLAGLWPFAAAVGHVLLAMILFMESVRPSSRVGARRGP